MAIGLSHGGSNVYSSSEQSRQLWVATKDGLVLLERLVDRAWRVSHRALRGLHISSIIFERPSGLMFAGAFFGSVHASADGGKTWERRDKGLTMDDVYSLACTVVDGQVRVYVGTQPAHLFCSEDLGQHWTELPTLRSVPSAPTWSFPAPLHVAHTKFITFDPQDPTTIYACIEQGALLKSTDSGKSWIEVNAVGFFRDKDRSAEHSVTTWHKSAYAGGHIYRSAAGGRSWRRLGGGLPNSLKHEFGALCIEDWNGGCSVFAAITGGEVYGSDDGGENWSLIVSGLAPISKKGHERLLAAS